MSVATATVPDDTLYEVVDGQIKEKTVGVRQSEIATLLIGFIFTFLRQHRLGRVLGETMFRIDVPKDLQRRPDVAFVSHAKWPLNRRAPNVSVWDMVPDLAIEDLCPSDLANDLQDRICEYFTAGVSRAWVIYPGHRIIYDYSSRSQIQVLKLGEELDGGKLFPGFKLPLRALFEDDPE